MPVSKPRKPSIKQSIQQAKMAEAVVPVCLRGDLAQAVSELEATRAARLNAATDSLAGKPDTADLDAQIADMRAKQAEHTFDFRLRELSYRRWDRLEMAHPPKDPQKERINMATFAPAMLRAVVVEPQLDTEDWDMLLGKRTEHRGDCKLDGDTDNENCTCMEPVLSKAQFTALVDQAVTLNQKDTQLPLALLASMVRQFYGKE